VPEGQHDLDQPEDPGCRFEVAEDRRRRTGQQRPPPVAGPAGHDRVARRLEVVHSGWIGPGDGVRVGHHLLVRGPAGGAAAEHRQYAVAVAAGVGEAFQHDHPAAFAGVRRREQHVDPGGEHQVGLPTRQRAGRVVDGDQRRRAPRVHDHARPAQVEPIRYPVRDHRCGHPGVGEPRVVRGRDAGEHSGPAAAQRAGRDAGVLERGPGRLQEDPLPRVHRRGVGRVDPEEGGVEPGRKALVVGPRTAVGRHDIGPGQQHAPQLVRRLDTARQAAADAEHGDGLTGPRPRPGVRLGQRRGQRGDRRNPPEQAEIGFAAEQLAEFGGDGDGIPRRQAQLGQRHSGVDRVRREPGEPGDPLGEPPAQLSGVGHREPSGVSGPPAASRAELVSMDSSRISRGGSVIHRISRVESLSTNRECV
jgi:hypothetical protein